MFDVDAYLARIGLDRRGSLAERLFRDVRATEIYQGTSEAQRLIISKAILSGL